jgi:hypothetical protein
MVVPLPYTLHTRYASIAIAWTVILIPPIFINLGLFYGLWYATNLDRILGLSLPLSPFPLFTPQSCPSRDLPLTTLSPHPPDRHPRNLHHNRHSRKNLQAHPKVPAIPAPQLRPVCARYLPMGILPRSPLNLRPYLQHARARRYRQRWP